MKPGSVMLVTASMRSEKAMSTPLMATSAQLMCSPTQGSTHTQKMTAWCGGWWAGGDELEQCGRQRPAGSSQLARETAARDHTVASG